jgi:cell division septation protein DedD
VSVSYHIDPLTHEETCAYIYHRMSIASRGAPTHFESSALKRIYKFSEGIPRMINIACNKSLATAHQLHHRHITGEIAKTALQSLAGTSRYRRSAFLNPRRTALLIAGSCLLLLLAAVAFLPRQPDSPAVAAKTEVKPAIIIQPEKPEFTPQPAAVPKPVQKVSMPNLPEFSKSEESVVRSASPAPPGPVPEKRLEPPAKMNHSVQVGAFRSRVPAMKLVGILKQKGYPAGILPVTDSKARTWYTVRIGDFPTKEAAVQHAHEYTSREKMESAVRPFGKL